MNDITDKLPDSDKIFGKAVSSILEACPSPYGTHGYVRRYEKGSIYHIIKPGKPKLDLAKIEAGMSFRVFDRHPIGIRYDTLGGSASELGFPITLDIKSEISLQKDWESPGSLQIFEGGEIYFCERWGAHAVLANKIREKFAKSEQYVWEMEGNELTGGRYGYPIGEQMAVFSSTKALGNIQRFEHGLIIDWSAGVFGIMVGIYHLYRSIKEWNGVLGFPSDDADFIDSAISGVDGHIQYFEKGCITWNSETDKCYYITGEIYSKWKTEKEKYGFPINKRVHLKNGFKQLFEGGVISQ